MNEFYKEVLTALQAEDKERTVLLTMNALKENKLSVVDLYEKILAPGLASVIDEYPILEDLIWREHVRSGIIRTIIESAYPYILEQRKEPNGQKVIVLCPEHEEHELGARMVADFFRLEGFNATFVGARTPASTIHKAIEIVEPDYLVISVTNFYNFVSVKKTIEDIRKKSAHDLTIVVGGRAISANPEAVEFVGADFELNGYEAIKELREGAE